MPRPARRSSFLAALTLSVGALLSASGPASIAAADDPGRPVSAPRAMAAAEEQATLQYWTAERLARARPMKAPDPGRRKPKVIVSGDVGPGPRLVPAQGIAHDPEGRIASAAAEQPSLIYPFPFTRRPLEKQLRAVRPYTSVGRVFFTRGGNDYSCTGVSVASAPRQVVYTAGHCLNDGTGKWSKNVVFVPAFHGTAAPYGRFPGKVLWVPHGWSSGGDFSFDLGAFSVGKNASGRFLQAVVGALGFAYNQSRIQHWNVIGYPALSPFNGKRQQLCSASHAVDDKAEGAGPDTIGIGCDMNGGSSGSPFVKDLGRGSYVNGILSYGREGQPLAAYSPYFDFTANDLRCAAATGKVPPDPGSNFNGACKLP
jgi:V8-like Glu-specific endopeptidase